MKSFDSDGAPVALVTGSARRIGAAIARKFHDRSYRVLLHCRNSTDEAGALAAEFNTRRGSSAAVLVADLACADGGERIARQALAQFRRVDVLVNNASGYYPVRFGEVSAEQWDDLLGSNLRGHFFLSQALGEELQSRGGAIVNIGDIFANRARRGYSVYTIAKAGLHAMTRSLALELAPSVRVNTIAPGPILWPEHLADESDPEVAEERRKIMRSIPMQTRGNADQVADLCWFLAVEATYMTGQTVRMDGGRFLDPG
ncbi:MAG: pteridine reductase [Gammaproteobacteria bacterium]|nr:pteridine reductase [Gammaproteobacteria bacterium]